MLVELSSDGISCLQAEICPTVMSKSKADPMDAFIFNILCENVKTPVALKCAATGGMFRPLDQRRVSIHCWVGLPCALRVTTSLSLVPSWASMKRPLLR